jgi:2-dehydro-3-deoxyphosphogalactonate aldolase
VLKAWRAVFPPGAPMLPVGGVGVANLAAFKAAGAAGAGIGSSLYAPGVALDELGRRARALVAAWAA